MALPQGWRHEPDADEDCFAVESQDGTKKIYVRVILPGAKQRFDLPATIARFEQIVTESGQKTLDPIHERFADEVGSAPPYRTRLIASYAEKSHFGLAAMTFVTLDHQLWVSVHDYWSEGRSSFEQFFRDIFQRFRSIATNET